MPDLDRRRSIGARAIQAVNFIEDFKKLVTQASARVSGGTIYASEVEYYNDKLAANKASFQSYSYGSLTDADVRAAIANDYPDDFADAAAVTTFYGTVNTQFTAYETAADALLATTRGVAGFDNWDTAKDSTNLITFASTEATAYGTALTSILSALNA